MTYYLRHSLERSMLYRATVLFLLLSCSLLFIANTRAAESPSLKETLAWVNAKFEGFSLVASREPAVSGGYMVVMMSDFDVAVTGAGKLRTTFNSLIASGGRRDNDRTVWEQDLNKCRSEDIVITTPDRTIAPSLFAGGGCEKVIAVRKANGLHVIIPLPRDSGLHLRLLKAFRNIVEQSKAAAANEPF
jgi:hypothetical protein